MYSARRFFFVSPLYNTILYSRSEIIYLRGKGHGGGREKKIVNTNRNLVPALALTNVINVKRPPTDTTRTRVFPTPENSATSVNSFK